METNEALRLRRLLAANIKERRGKLAISQEKLAELADVSVQTVNFIEGCRTWVSDKTLAKLACALRVDAYRLLSPTPAGEPEPQADAQSLDELKQLIKYDIDRRFAEANARHSMSDGKEHKRASCMPDQKPGGSNF